MPSPSEEAVPSYLDAVFIKDAPQLRERAGGTLQMRAKLRGQSVLSDEQRDAPAPEGIAGRTLPGTLDALRELGELAASVVPEPLRGAPANIFGMRGTNPFRQIKKLMIHGAEGYLGAMAATLVQRIAAANDQEQVRLAMGHWRMAMRESKYGRAEVSDLMVRVTALLHDASLVNAH